VSVSVGAVMKPAGLEKSAGIISAGYLKEPTDPQWANTPEYKEWLDQHGGKPGVPAPPPNKTQQQQ